MGKIAVDVALIPPAAVMNKAIAINREVVKRHGTDLVLGKKICLPHITLV